MVGGTSLTPELKMRVGRFSCTLTLVNGTVSCQWKPTVPKGLNATEWRQYRAGRETFLRTAFPGRDIVVVEV